jgi:transcriptional regulator
MYVPRKFENKDIDHVRQFISENGFGILITQSPSKISATHVPLVLSSDGNKLHGHLSSANQQVKTFQDSEEVLAIFNGPHAYISSSWYNHENVPTWNYIAVHVYGKIRIIEGDELLSSLKDLVDKYERHSKRPVSVENMSPDYLNKQINGIIGFEIAISRMEAAYKLSQNRDQVNHQTIINELNERNHGDDRKVALEMKKHAPENITS